MILLNSDLTKNIKLKIFLYKKRKEINRIQYYIDKNLWIFKERMQIKENGEPGILSRNPCTFEQGPMMNRNGTKDLNLISMYKLTSKIKPKKEIGSSVDVFKKLQESLNVANKTLKRFERIKSISSKRKD
jgi:hypothetical protein